MTSGCKDILIRKPEVVQKLPRPPLSLFSNIWKFFNIVKLPSQLIHKLTVSDTTKKHQYPIHNSTLGTFNWSLCGRFSSFKTVSYSRNSQVTFVKKPQIKILSTVENQTYCHLCLMGQLKLRSQSLNSSSQIPFICFKTMKPAQKFRFCYQLFFY